MGRLPRQAGHGRRDDPVQGSLTSSEVELIVLRGRIVIQPSENVTYSLDKLLAGITASNAHGELSFGKPVGKEEF